MPENLPELIDAFIQGQIADNPQPARMIRIQLEGQLPSDIVSRQRHQMPFLSIGTMIGAEFAIGIDELVIHVNAHRLLGRREEQHRVMIPHHRRQLRRQPGIAVPIWHRRPLRIGKRLPVSRLRIRSRMHAQQIQRIVRDSIRRIEFPAAIKGRGGNRHRAKKPEQRQQAKAAKANINISRIALSALHKNHSHSTRSVYEL